MKRLVKAELENEKEVVKEIKEEVNNKLEKPYFNFRDVFYLVEEDKVRKEYDKVKDEYTSFKDFCKKNGYAEFDIKKRNFDNEYVVNRFLDENNLEIEEKPVEAMLKRKSNINKAEKYAEKYGEEYLEDFSNFTDEQFEAFDTFTNFISDEIGDVIERIMAHQYVNYGSEDDFLDYLLRNLPLEDLQFFTDDDLSYYINNIIDVDLYAIDFDEYSLIEEYKERWNVLVSGKGNCFEFYS